jgi:hypothetical protein
MWTEGLTAWRDSSGCELALRNTTAFDAICDPNMLLRDRLWIGCEIGATKIDKITPKIRACVSLHAQGPSKCGYRRFDGIQYHHVIVDDAPDADIAQHFIECTDFIHYHITQNGGGGVYVHCAAGVSRSVTICMAYLIRVHHVSVDQAFMMVYCVRPIVWPNSGFIEQLREFERTLAQK